MSGFDAFDLTPSQVTTNIQRMNEEGPGFLITPEESLTYGHLYKLLDVESRGFVTSATVVPFLMKSKLSQSVLRDVWNLVDVEGKGSLSQPAFFKCLKLIALAQSGKPASLAYLNQSTPLPMFEGVALDALKPLQMQHTGHRIGSISSHTTGTPQPISSHTTGTAQPISVHSTGNARSALAIHSTGNKSITVHSTGNRSFTPNATGVGVTVEEKERYKAAFASCQPQNGSVSGDQARELFMKSGLPLDILGQIWGLVDVKGAGVLNLQQFMVAMYFIMKLKTGSLTTVPSAIPPTLWTAMSESTSTPATPIQPAQPLLPPVQPAQPLPDTPLPTSISPENKATFDGYFDSLDTSNTGFVSGQDAYTFFLKSKLPETELAAIWDAADKNKTGRLNRDQFAFAMSLIRHKMAHPTVAPPSLAPPVDLLDFSSPLSSPKPTAAPVSVPPMSQPVLPLTTTTLKKEPISMLDPTTELESQLKTKKQELLEAEKIFSSLNPATEELKTKRTELEMELKKIMDERNQITLKMSQARALYEAEKHILAETQAVIARDRQTLDVARQELAQAERAVELMTNEKNSVLAQSKHIQEEIEECKRQSHELSEKSVGLRTSLEQLRAEFITASKMLEVNQKLLSSSQTEYQQLKMDVSSAEARLEHDKSRAQAISNQIAVQSVMNEKEKQKVKTLNDSISSLAVSQNNLNSSGIAKSQTTEFSFEAAMANSNKSREFSSSNVNLNRVVSNGVLSSSSASATSGPFAVPTTIAPAPKTDREELDALFDANVPKPKPGSFVPEFSGTSSNYPSSTKSLTLESSQTTKERPASVRSLNVYSTNQPTPTDTLDVFAVGPPPRPPSSTKPAATFMLGVNNAIQEVPETSPEMKALTSLTSAPPAAPVAAISSVNFDEEMKKAFGPVPPTVRSTSPSKLDDTVFQSVSTDFGDDAFKFQATFDTSKPVQTMKPKKEDPFAAAFGGSSMDSVGLSASMNGKKTDAFDSAFTSKPGVPSGATSKIDFEAAFGSSHFTTGNTATPFSFDDAFGSASFHPAAPAKPATSSSPTKSEELSEVKQLVSMGFTKEKAIAALEKFGYDVTKATNHLLG